MITKTSRVGNLWVIMALLPLFIGCPTPSGPQNPDGTGDIEYSIRGVGPAGGYIFYENPDWEDDGWRYLELAPAPAAGQMDPDLIWGDTTVSVATAPITLSDMNNRIFHPGSGKANTDAIVAALGDPGDGEVYAAWYADQLVVTNGTQTFDDWYLPAPGEWRLIYEVLYSPRGDFEGMAPLGGLLNSPYWSSSQVETRADLARYINLQTDSDTNWNNQPLKSAKWRVRAIRMF